jgi:hypothetical protein
LSHVRDLFGFIAGNWFMSKIVFFLNECGPMDKEVKSLIYKDLSIGLRDIKLALNEHLPLFEKKLFCRNTPEFPFTLLETMKKLDSFGAKYSAYELLNKQSYIAEESYFEVTPEKLENMIFARRKSLNSVK